MSSIREMLNPQSVALIGATEKESSVGRAVFANLLRGANRQLYPVNPNRQTVLGIPCFPSIGDVPAHVSLAVIVTPARVVPAIVEECGKVGVAGAIILSAGFGEADTQGKILEREIIEIRRKYRLRIIGPNCLGVILPHIGLNTTFLTTDPKPGNIALISRALGDSILDWGGTIGIGFSMFASLGSMIDVGYGDLIDFLSEDYDTRSIMIYMENVGDPRRFISAARAFAMRKPIILLRPGRSKAGAQFITTRTGAQIGDDRVYDAVFKRVGVVRVMEMADLFNMAEVLDSRYLPRGPRLAIVTDAGDVGIMATDTLAQLGGKLARISDGNTDELDLLLPERWSRDDPIDMVGGSDTGRYINTIEACLRNSGVDGILVIYTPRAAGDAMGLARAVIEMSRKTTKPVIVTWIGGERAAEGRRILLQRNVPAYATPEEAVKTYLYMYHYKRNIDLLYQTPAEVAQTNAPLKNYLKKTMRDAVTEQRHTLSYEHSFDLLRNYRIRTVIMAVVTDSEEFLQKGREVGFPLLLTTRHLHQKKEDEVFSLTSEDQVNRVWLEARSKLGWEGAINRQDVEIVLRKVAALESYRLKLESRRDPEFRTVLVLSPGVGGTDDVCIGLPPLNQTLARRLLEGTAVYRILKDTDTGERALKNLEETLINFSNLMVDFAEIESLELVLSIWQADVLAQDIKVILCSNYDDSSPYPHLVISPYPSHFITTWSLPSGTEVLLRPVRPEDEPMSREMYGTVSEETLRERFFTPMKITHDLLIRSCNIDYDREIAILAEIKDGEKEKMIGGIRLISDSDSERAQFAILVHDDYQRMGLGAKLFDIMIGIAQEKGLGEIYGSVLSDNGKMLALCRRFGFRVKFESYSVSRVSLSLKDPI